MTIITAPNIATEISYTFSGHNNQAERWEVTPLVVKRNLVTGEVLSTDNRRLTIINQPATGDDPEGTELTEFMASFDGIDSLREATVNKIIERRGIVEWDGSVIDDIENDPNATDVKLWDDVIGTLVAPPNRIDFEGTIYDVIQPHVAATQWTPPTVPALFAVSQDQGGEGLPEWVQPTGANPYPLGAQVTHNGLCWESANPANVWEPGATGIGDNIWFQIECPV